MTRITGLCRAAYPAMFAAAVAITGCTKSGNKPGVPAAGPAAATTPRSVWEPDPARAGELTQMVTFDRYQMSLPKDFAAEKLTGVPPKDIQVFVWKAPAAGDRPPLVLISTIMAGKAAVAEAKKNMRQALVNWSAGMANSSGIKIAKRGATETGTISGLAFSRFKWTGTTADGGPANGMAYGTVDDAQALLLMPISFQQNPETDMRLMEAVLATLHKP